MTDQSLLIRPPDPGFPTVASDLEGTLTSGTTVRAIHRYMEENGLQEESRAIYRKRMPVFILGRVLRLDLRKQKNDWMRDLISRFAGRAGVDLRRMTDYVAEESIWLYRRQDVVDELNTHLGAGRRVIIVSGMPVPILSSLLKFLPGFEAIGTGVIGSMEPFSGELGEFTVGARKVAVLRPFCDSSGKIHAAYGDTYSDRVMLEMSRNPTAVSPDRKLRQAAVENGWKILDT